MSDEILANHDSYEAVTILNRGNVLLALESRNNPSINAFVFTSKTDSKSTTIVRVVAETRMIFSL